MSVDGSLLTDLRQLRAQPAFITIAVTGPKGCGKSFALAQVIKGYTGTQYAELVHSLQDCLNTPAAALRDEDAATVSTAPLLSVAPRTLREDCLSTIASAGSSDAGLRPGTLLIMDDIEALWALAVMSNTQHLLLRLFRLAQRGTGCRVLFSAHDVNSIPYCLRKDERPLVYAMPPLTQAAARRTVRTIASSAPSFSCFESCGAALTPSSTRRDLVLAMTMAACPAPGPATPELAAAAMARHLDFLHGDAAAASATGPPPTLFGLEPVLSRLGLLVSVFATGSAAVPGGKLLRSLKSTTGVLLHGPSGCGKSAVVREVARRHPHISFTFVQCTTLFSKYLGESEEQLRDVYRAARAAAPSVVVLDEVDVLAQSRQGGADGGSGDGGKSSVSVTRRMLACLLCELDGIADNSGVLTVATTNAPHVLDSALLRQGRLETMLAVPPLSYDAALTMSQSFFATFQTPIPPADVLGGAEAESALATTTWPPLPQQPVSLAEKVAQAGTGCAPTNLHYLLRKILEHHLTSLPEPRTSDEPDAPLPMPSPETVQACLFECASVLSKLRYVDPFAI